MFLAEHVRLEPNGMMSVPGLGVTYLQVSHLPVPYSRSVAGRLLFDDTEDRVTATLTVIGADHSFELSLVTEIDLNLDETAIDGPRSAPFAANVTLPLPVEGRDDVTLGVEGAELARQSFFVVHQPLEQQPRESQPPGRQGKAPERSSGIASTHATRCTGVE